MTSMEPSFIAIARKFTHTNLNVELTLIMVIDEMSKLWKKIFMAHKKETLMIEIKNDAHT